MIGYVSNIRELIDKSSDFRRVLYTGTKLQLVLLSVEPGQDHDGEIHADTDQFFYIEDGKGRVVIDGVPHKVSEGDGIVVPAGAHHIILCTGHHAVKLYAIYGPPHHRDQLVQTTREDAPSSEGTFDGQPTEQAAAVVRV